ncbi:LysM peptidoglycan-binding domain-containing protein [Vibrio sp. BS-M-Sm-2]|uniref:LysM peptidoglycan-binding domain-containing protein n=1 Tax=Vibrio sp. BS-M-Sm-2 TaxID=3241167 RepID=UPI0035592B0A
MKEIILMQLPSFLRSISSTSSLTFSLVLLSFSSFAQSNDIAIRAGVGLYNEIDNSSSVSENLSSNFVVGTQLPINDFWSVSLDGFFFENIASSAYVGTTVDYTAQMSDDFELYGRLGVDFVNGETIPKAGLGIEKRISNTLGLTMETIARDTDRFADYQFIIGAKFSFPTDNVIETPADEGMPDIYTQEPEEKVIVKELDQVREENEHAKRPPKYYRVIKGDTLWGISLRKGIALNRLIHLNETVIETPDLIYPGDILKL